MSSTSKRTPKASSSSSAARRPNVERSLDKLVPSFRVKVDQLLGLMRAAGFRPLVWETYRTPERALELEKEGTGVAKSQHSLGLAVDILEEGTLWDAPQAFWDALHQYALDLGLGRIKHRAKNGSLTWDPPHVQSLPGRYDGQLFKLADAAAREQFLQSKYAA